MIHIIYTEIILAITLILFAKTQPYMHHHMIIYIVTGDFNIEADSKEMSSFYDTFDLTIFIKQPRCYKNPDNPSCIDLILTDPSVFKTGLFDFHRMILIVTKMTFQKLKPRVMNYRDYKHFNNERFRDDLLSGISNSYLEFDNSFDEFSNMCRSTLDQHALRKRKYARGESYAIYE